MCLAQPLEEGEGRFAVFARQASGALRRVSRTNLRGNYFLANINLHHFLCGSKRNYNNKGLVAVLIMASSQDRALALAPDRVLDIAAKALSQDGEQAQLKNAYEAVALVGHACMVAVGFRLVGLGEDHKLGWPSVFF